MRAFLQRSSIILLMAAVVGWGQHWGSTERREWRKEFRDLCYKFDINGAILGSGGGGECEHALRWMSLRQVSVSC